MRRKLFLTILLIFALFAIFSLKCTVKAAEPTYNEDTGYILNGTQKCFFANGTPISIEEREDGQEGASIFWEGGTKHVDVPSDINVFGAGHAESTNYESTEITMNGGTVKNVFGGGLHESHVTTSNVTINGGKISSSVTGGGANVFTNSDYCQPTNVTAENSPTRVVNANVTVNNGTIYNVFGGGEGLSNTENVTLKINGGNISYVTGGGSNGYTKNTNVKVTSGRIELLQSVNRGKLVLADVRVSGGTIDKLYVGGEVEQSVTGTIDQVSLDITGGTIVNNLYLGVSGGKAIDPNTTKVDVDIYLGATVNIANRSEFDNISLTQYVFVTINNTRYELEKGKTLVDLAELASIKNVEGKDFIKFVKKDTEEVFEENTVIDGDIELTAIYKDKEVQKPVKPMDETPKTGENKMYEVFAITMIMWTVIGIAIMSKVKE